MEQLFICLAKILPPPPLPSPHPSFLVFALIFLIDGEMLKSAETGVPGEIRVAFHFKDFALKRGKK